MACGGRTGDAGFWNKGVPWASHDATEAFTTFHGWRKGVWGKTNTVERLASLKSILDTWNWSGSGRWTKPLDNCESCSVPCKNHGMPPHRENELGNGYLDDCEKG